MYRLHFLLFIAFVINSQSTLAQEEDPWVLGVGFNVVDNSGSRFNELFNVKDNWNASRILKFSAEKRIEHDYGIEASLTINRFNTGKTINSEIIAQKTNYFAIDLMFKNYTTNYFLNTKHSLYTGYVAGGLGGNFFDGILNKTLNLGFGINIRIKYHLRINLQTVGKFSIDNNTPGNANHIQHSISIIKWI